MKALNIRDYALIGNSRAAALVGKNGAIDWCCLPEFNSPAVFAALLGDNGGCFAITPVGEFTSKQEYEGNTNVVKTTFQTAGGSAKSLDGFTVMSEADKEKHLFADHEILRIVEGVSGNVEFRLEFVPGIFYGKQHARLSGREKLGIHFAWKEHIFILTSTLPSIDISESGDRATAVFNVAAGDKVIFSFAYSSQSPAIIPEIEVSGEARMEGTIAYWNEWISRCNYNGRYREQVQRSALTLKLLSHAPSGAIVAAPTTSLPEQPGTSRNWDYRYCWLRDASFTTRALINLGYYDEMEAYLNWIQHATQLTWPRLQVVYSVFGKSRLNERTAPWLKGYKDSAPVRLGNNAHKQFQLDVYGEVLDAIYSYAKITDNIDHSMQKFALGLGKMICKMWDKPDDGIWEIRSHDKHHTHSKVMAWVGLDRLIKLSAQYDWKNTSLDLFKAVKAKIQEEVEVRGYSREVNSYVRAFDSADTDASLLTLSLVGYCHADSARMVGTTELICSELSKNNLVYRYKHVDDGVGGAEGAFLICSFWLSENLVKMGRVEEGIEVFETVLRYASPTGLLPEELDADSGEMRGNYPQGFTHIGLINAAIAIDELEKRTAI